MTQQAYTGRESHFCDVCNVAYDSDYTGPCQEPAKHATDAQLVRRDYPRCPGTVSWEEAVRMQRRRAEEAEARVKTLEIALNESEIQMQEVLDER